MGAVLKPCGTYAAYRRHVRRGEAVDELCAQAARDEKSARVVAKREESAAAVAAAVEPVVVGVDELVEALENLRIVRAAMSDAPANAVAGLSKRREELVRRIVVLEKAVEPEMSALDQLAQRRAERLAKAAI